MHTHRLSRFDGYESVVALFPTDVAKGPVVCDVLSNVGNLMDCMVVLKNLKTNKCTVYSFTKVGEHIIIKKAQVYLLFEVELY